MAVDIDGRITEKDVIGSILDNLIEKVDKCKWKHLPLPSSTAYTLTIEADEWVVLKKSIHSQVSFPLFSMSIHKKDFSTLANIPDTTNKNNQEHLAKVEKLFNIIDKTVIAEKSKHLDKFLTVLDKLVEEED